MDTQRDQDTEDAGKRRSTRGRRRDTSETEGPASGEPLGDDRDLGADQGHKRGGRTDAVYGGRRRHVSRGAETSGRGWRVAGVGNIQVEGIPCRERRWGAGVTERCYGNDRY